MTYVLGLSFTYHWYKRDAVLRVFADDHLVDEITLSKSIEKKTFKRYPLPFENKIPDNQCGVMIEPEKLFLFNISEQYLTRHIRIEVTNDNNNYTNGFMSKYSYILFHKVFFMPHCLLDIDNWKKIERLDAWESDDHLRFFPSLVRNFEEMYQCGLKDLWTYPQGGSFNVEIPLSKKHNVIHFGKFPPGKIFISWEVARILANYNALNTPV